MKILNDLLDYLKSFLVVRFILLNDATTLLPKLPKIVIFTNPMNAMSAIKNDDPFHRQFKAVTVVKQDWVNHEMPFVLISHLHA